MNKYQTIVCIFSILVSAYGRTRSLSRRNDESDTPNNIEGDHAMLSEDSDVGPKLSNIGKDGQNCWMSLNARQHFATMDELDAHYKKVRSSYHNQVAEELNKEMLEGMLNIRGMAEREIHKAKGNINLIPAGLNLGGYCMMRMKDSVLFFHRMKLRNDTRFRVNFLQNDLQDMTLTVRLSLHDLHLVGAYERSPTDKDPSILFYTPSYGELEFLLKNVDYKMEGRLRLIKDRLIIELVISEIIIDDILMTYLSKEFPGKPLRLQKENLEDFLERLKTDLDKWLMDYFNDYLMFSTALGSPHQNFLQAEKDRAMVLNEYADSSLNIIKNKIRKLGGTKVKIPNFTFYGATRMLVRLKDGYLSGLDSIYKRSVATGKRQGKVRNVDLIVGFSNLKVGYQYEAVLPTNAPPLIGNLILSADELTAHMALSLVKDPETVDLDFDYIQQMKPESLTVEGPANRMIANFKHLLEHHIIAIMTNTLLHTIKSLKTLPKCKPFLLKYVDIKDRSGSGQDNDNSESFKLSLENYEDSSSGHDTPVLHVDDHGIENYNGSNRVPTIYHIATISLPNFEASIEHAIDSSDHEIKDEKIIRRHHHKTTAQTKKFMMKNTAAIKSIQKMKKNRITKQK